MKVSYILAFTGQSEFVEILIKQLKKHVFKILIFVLYTWNLKEIFFLFFQWSNQPSDAWKSLEPNCLAKKEGFGF